MSNTHLPFVFQFNYFQNHFRCKTQATHPCSVSYSNDIAGSEKPYTTVGLQNKMCNLALYRPGLYQMTDLNAGKKQSLMNWCFLGC